MNNLATKNQDDYTVREDGSAYTTQRKAAEMCGVKQPSIQHLCMSNNIDISQGLSSESVAFVCQHYARKGRPEAVAMLVKFARAGAQAYIYSEAGYTLHAVRNDAAIPAVVDYGRIAEMIAVALAAALKPLTSAQSMAYPAAGAVAVAEFPTRAAVPLAPGFSTMREIRQGIFRGHSEQVVLDAMAAAGVEPRYFDIQYDELHANPTCRSFQSNLVEAAYHNFIRHSTRKVKADGSVSAYQWSNPLLSGSNYKYAGEYEVRAITFL